jgi:hypothetical protein
MAKTNYRKEFPKLIKNINGEQFEMDAEEYEATIVQWEANDAKLLTTQAEAEARKAEAETKATAKAALLTQLGITAEQAKLLLS